MRILGLYLGMGVFFGLKVLTFRTWAHIQAWALFRYRRYFGIGVITGEYGIVCLAIPLSITGSRVTHITKQLPDKVNYKIRTHVN